MKEAPCSFCGALMPALALRCPRCQRPRIMLRQIRPSEAAQLAAPRRRRLIAIALVPVVLLVLWRVAVALHLIQKLRRMI